MAAKMTTTSLLLAYVHFSLAQQSVLSIPFYGYDTQSIVASVVSADSTATTLQLACPSGTDGNDCGLFPYQTLTIGPNTYHMDMSGDGFTGTQDCKSTSVCAESAGGSGANFPGASTTTYEADDIETFPVTITAGASKTAAAGNAATTTGAGSTSSSESATADLTTLVGGQTTSAASQTSESTSSGTAAASSGTSTGAAVTGAGAGFGAVAVAGAMGVFGMMG